MRDHGGNLDWAMERWGGAPGDWVDLSTGINPVPYPVPEISARSWTALPTQADLAGLCEVAKAACGITGDVLPVAGAQAAIQMMPRLMAPGAMRVLGPTYNEHAASFLAAGWEVEEVADVQALAGAEVAVLVNPNNPDGRRWVPEVLRDLAGKVGFLIVDESFADPEPGLSLGRSVPDNALILRSFGKFYGLAGLRLGFVLGRSGVLNKLSAIAGPWPVSGAAIEVGRAAMSDTAWHAATVSRLAKDAARLDELALGAGWDVVGGTTLFRLYQVPDARAVQGALAEQHVWSRVFPYATDWMRLGLPGLADWDQVERAIEACRA